jgi:hypothetical protein
MFSKENNDNNNHNNDNKSQTTIARNKLFNKIFSNKKSRYN